jgi:cell division protein FtsW
MAETSRRGKGEGAAHVRPLEYRLIITVTLCLLAYGAIMVYSSSSPLTLANGRGSG